LDRKSGESKALTSEIVGAEQHKRALEGLIAEMNNLHAKALIEFEESLIHESESIHSPFANESSSLRETIDTEIAELEEPLHNQLDLTRTVTSNKTLELMDRPEKERVAAFAKIEKEFAENALIAMAFEQYNEQFNTIRSELVAFCYVTTSANPHKSILGTLSATKRIKLSDEELERNAIRNSIKALIDEEMRHC
jgi:hypothetical protein